MQGMSGKFLKDAKDACLVLVEEIRTDRQLAEVAKVYKNGGTDIALVMTDAEKKKAPCFAIRDGKTCTDGSSSLQPRHQDHRGGQGES